MSSPPKAPDSNDHLPLDLGPFTVERYIGRGGMASVWGGRHRASGAAVAVKVIDAERARDQRYRVAFAHEVRAVARLDHPAIVRIFDHGALGASPTPRLPAGAPYLVMQQLDGPPLDEGPAARRWPEMARALAVLLDGLAHAHARGVVHRDLKPENVLGGPEGPVLTDFGLASRPGRDPGHAGAGTPGFMAPEQIRGEWRRFGPATDLYALGCLAWALACGAPPHWRPGLPPLALAMAHVSRPPPPFEPRFTVPARLEGWLRRLLAPAPEQRYAFAAEALAGLRSIVDNRPLEPPPLPDDWRTDARPPQPATLVGVGRALFGHRVWPPTGREPDRDRLWRALRGVIAGRRTRAVLIEGPSGSGKTHLAAWLAERAHRAGQARTLTARHQPLGGPGDADGLGPMLARHFGVVDGAVHHALPAISALPAVRGDRRAVEIAALAAPDGVCADGPNTVRLDRAARLDLMPGALRALASDRPLVIVVDDLQWGEEALRTVERLLGGAEAPILLLLTVRTEGVERGSALDARLAALRAHDAVDALTLGPLDPAAHRRIIRAMLPVHDSLVDALVERAAGSPLFAAELMRYFIGAGLLRDGPGGYRLASGAEAALPRGLQALWQARLVEALGGEAEAAWGPLQVAAALGLTVDGDTWTAACARAGVRWSRVGLERLLDARLMHIDRAGEWAFCHAMLRETLIAAARAGGDWAVINRACADALAERGAAPLRIAEHRLAAGQDAAALEPLRAASEQAALDAELDLLERIVQRRIGLLRRLRIPRLDARWEELRLHRARLDQRRGRYAPAIRRARRLRATSPDEPRLVTLALHVESNARYYTDGPRSSLPLIASALPMARAAGDPGLIELMLSEYASTLMFLGRLDEAEAALLEGWRHIAGRGRPRREGGVLYYLANVHAFREEPPPGIARCRQAREAFRRAGSRHLEGLTWSVEGDLERRQGDLDRAAGCYRAFADCLRATGPSESAYLALNAALLDLARGRFEAARRGLAEAARHDLSTQRAVIVACDLAGAAGLGDWLMWDAAATRLIGLVVDAPLSPDVPWAAERAAALAEAAGQPERAAFARRIAADHRRRLRGG